MARVATDISFEQVPEELRTLAERGLSNARRELELTGKLNPGVFLRNPDGNIETIQLNNQMSRLFFGNGASRGAFFKALRATVEIGRVTAVVMVTDMYTAKPTAQFERLPFEEKKRVIDGNPSIDALVQRGLMTRHEAIMVNVQTAEQVAMVEQIYERDTVNRRITWGVRTANCFPQETLDGRMKMFGKQEGQKA